MQVPTDRRIWLVCLLFKIGDKFSSVIIGDNIACSYILSGFTQRRFLVILSKVTIMTNNQATQGDVYEPDFTQWLEWKQEGTGYKFA